VHEGVDSLLHSNDIFTFEQLHGNAELAFDEPGIIWYN
jgi:hypothetical protein